MFEKGMGLISKEYTFTVSESEMQKIYDSAIQNKFFSLQDDYTDMTIIDGGWKEIHMTADGETKSVRLTNFKQENFNKVSLEIRRIIVSKLTEEAFSLESRREDCPQKEIECIDNESIECEEWKYFCKWEEEKVELTAEYCDKLENRVECMLECTEEGCGQEICDALVFEAEGCTECGFGCCDECSNLDECADFGCTVAWVHPSGENWQYGGCGNADYCQNEALLCDYINYSVQGYAYHTAAKDTETKSAEYLSLSQELEALYDEECGE